MAETTHHDLIKQAIEDQMNAIQTLANTRSSIASAITAKGVDTPNNTVFANLASKIAQIKVGATIATGTVNTDNYPYKEISIPCGFIPTLTILHYKDLRESEYDIYDLIEYGNTWCIMYSRYKEIDKETTSYSNGIYTITSPKFLSGTTYVDNFAKGNRIWFAVK